MNKLLHQKPEKLLARIIGISSNEGDLILDSFCGSGTALAVAENITIPKNILLLSSSASSPSISTLDDKNLVFRTIASDTQQAYTLAQYLISKNEKEVIILYENDQYNETLTQIFLREYTEAGGTVKYKTQLTNKTIINEKFINAFDSYPNSLNPLISDFFDSSFHFIG